MVGPVLLLFFFFFPATPVSLLFFKCTDHIPSQGLCPGLSLCLTCFPLSYWLGSLLYFPQVFTLIYQSFKIAAPTAVFLIPFILLCYYYFYVST